MTSGDVLLCDLNPVAGREQGGIRPVVVVSHHRYSVIPGLFLAVPLTTRDRGLAHHIEVPADGRTGLKQISYAMTEQVRAMSDQRAGRQLGNVSDETLTAISRYLHLFIVLDWCWSSLPGNPRCCCVRVCQSPCIDRGSGGRRVCPIRRGLPPQQVAA